MKRLITSLMLFSFALTIAQNFDPYSNGLKECVIQEGLPMENFTQQEIYNAEYRNNQTDYVFNVFVHFFDINGAQYTDYYTDTNNMETKSLDIVGTLNLSFNNNGIFFKYSGYEIIPNSSNYIDVQSSHPIYTEMI